jgi:amidase
MTPDEYRILDATDLAALVRAGEVTDADIRAAARAMHDRTDDAINAVVEWYEEPTPVRDLDGPLAGVPVLRKDYGSAEAGRLVEMGSALAQGHRARTTGVFVDRLQAAGVQILGRSAVPEFIQHGTTESSVHGATRNPWNPEVSAGGSSGGAAAAVAAGVVPVAHASDCAGSIRIPAAACGLIGLKPSRRRVPWEDGGWGGIAEEFVVTRTVRDTEAFLGVLGDGPMLDAAGPLRIAISTDHWAGAVPDPEVVAATEAVAALLEELGHRVTPVDPPLDAELLAGTWHALFSRWVAHDVTTVAQLTGRPPGPDTLEPVTLAAIEAAAALTVHDVTIAQVAQGRIADRLRTDMADHDVLLTPTLGRPTIPLGHVGGDVASMGEYLRRNDVLMPYSYLFNVTGWPALTVPAGWAEGGIPLGVQLAAPIGWEPVLLGLGRAVEEAGLFGAPPGPGGQRRS